MEPGSQIVKKRKLIPRSVFDSPFIPKSLSAGAEESSPAIFVNADNKNAISAEWVKTHIISKPSQQKPIIGLKQVIRSIAALSSSSNVDISTLANISVPEFVLIEEPGKIGSGKPPRMIYDHLLLLCYLRNFPVFLMSLEAANLLAKHYNLNKCSVIAPVVNYLLLTFLLACNGSPPSISINI